MLSPDPVIQWCVEEAVTARVDHLEGRQAAHRAAILSAHGKAQAALAKAATA